MREGEDRLKTGQEAIGKTCAPAYAEISTKCKSMTFKLDRYLNELLIITRSKSSHDGPTFCLNY